MNARARVRGDYSESYGKSNFKIEIQSFNVKSRRYCQGFVNGRVQQLFHAALSSNHDVKRTARINYTQEFVCRWRFWKPLSCHCGFLALTAYRLGFASANYIAVRNGLCSSEVGAMLRATHFAQEALSQEYKEDKRAADKITWPVDTARSLRSCSATGGRGQGRACPPEAGKLPKQKRRPERVPSTSSGQGY